MNVCLHNKSITHSIQYSNHSLTLLLPGQRAQPDLRGPAARPAAPGTEEAPGAAVGRLRGGPLRRAGEGVRSLPLPRRPLQVGTGSSLNATSVFKYSVLQV